MPATKQVTAITRLERAIERHDERSQLLRAGHVSDEWIRSAESLRQPAGPQNGGNGANHPEPA